VRGVFGVDYAQTWPAETVHCNVIDWEQGYERLSKYQARRQLLHLLASVCDLLTMDVSVLGGMKDAALDVSVGRGGPQ